MSTNHWSTVAATFETRGQAENAIDELWHAGFPHEQIGIAAPGQSPTEAETRLGNLEGAGAEGAAVGAATGGAIGTVAGALVSTLVPGIGPLLTGGVLAGIALGAAAGAAAGGYIGPFIALGLSEDEAHFYESELKGGRSIVVVKSQNRAAEVVDILRRHGGRRLLT